MILSNVKLVLNGSSTQKILQISTRALATHWNPRFAILRKRKLSKVILVDILF